MSLGQPPEARHECRAEHLSKIHKGLYMMDSSSVQTNKNQLNNHVMPIVGETTSKESIYIKNIDI